MKLKIITYAAVKELFGKSFEIEIDDGSTIEQIKKTLIVMNPESEGLINKCRFALNDSIVNDNTPIKEIEYVHIIPPSSGG
jgi:molybdopterin converting factor small subunit